MNIKVDFDFIDFQRGLKAAAKDLFPKAIMDSLNDIAFESRTAINTHIGREFVVRRPWLQRQTQVTKATKTSLTAVIGSKAPFMRLHAEGGIKRPASGRSAVNIPTKILNPTNRVIARSKWPGRLLAKSTSRTRHYISPQGLLMKAVKNQPNRPLWMFKKSVRIEPRFKLIEQVRSVMDSRWEATMLRRLDKELNR